jgi:hypothetical protein
MGPGTEEETQVGTQGEGVVLESEMILVHRSSVGLQGLRARRWIYLE